MVHPQESLAIEDLFDPPAVRPGGPGFGRLLLALDGVEDPQNLGALLRVADGAGVDGVVLTERRSAPLSPVAVKASAGRRIDKELLARGVVARAQSHKGLAEEQPKAYKNVDDVVEVVHQAGLSKKVARMRPIGVIKG